MGSNVCCMCSSCPKESSDRRHRAAARMSQSHSNVYFLKSLGKYLHRGVGMPTVPYWLPAVTQEDGKMEGREREGGRGRGRIKGVVMMWGHEPRGSLTLSLSLLFLICLSDDSKQHGSSKEQRATSEGGEKSTKQCWRKRERELLGYEEEWQTILYVYG